MAIAGPPPAVTMRGRGPAWLSDWAFMFTTLPVFFGYATGFGLTRYLVESLGIPQDDQTARNIFSTASAMMSWGNLLFRFLHNVIFFFCDAWTRVLISIVVFIIGESLFIVIELTHANYYADAWAMPLVFVAYLLFGVAIGTYESNMLGVARTYSPRASHLGVLGMPVGCNVLMVGWFLLRIASTTIFSDINARIVGLVLLVCGFGVWIGIVRRPDAEYRRKLAEAQAEQQAEAGVASEAEGENDKNDKNEAAGLLGDDEVTPDTHTKSQEASLQYLIDGIRHWREWLPKVALASGCMFFACAGMFFVGPGFNQWSFGEGAKLWPGMTIDYNSWQMVASIFQFCGDFFSRQIVLHPKVARLHIPSWVFAIGSAVAIGLTLIAQPIVSWVSVFIGLGMNGAIYAQSQAMIRDTVPQKYTIIALSFWLLVGDLGSVITNQCMQAIAKARGF